MVATELAVPQPPAAPPAAPGSAEEEQGQDPGEGLRLNLPWSIKGLAGLAGLAIYVELVGGAVL